MRQPHIWNKRRKHPPDAVLVDRTTKWGNPFRIGRDGTREEVIAKFEVYFADNVALQFDLSELTGRDLLCHCAPERCHAEILLRWANPGPGLCGKPCIGYLGYDQGNPVPETAFESTCCQLSGHEGRGIPECSARSSPGRAS